MKRIGRSQKRRYSILKILEKQKVNKITHSKFYNYYKKLKNILK